ncbi:uncharacterized protein LOC129928325 isoform X2 [Biomphalaria glabrata]|uniref:Uncharacterized protein LOC129928325 isoform X2 n=1 Tax=Biomphalaria glabrata TaxID=6526 RepID=A0A9W3BF61_BIOGL|nr:uncharacterized protein LOC129928325 isoform X2 [Biomphalaria glabrata]
MKPGIRVVRGPDWTYEDQDGGEGHVGTVVQVPGKDDSSTPDKHVTVLWDNGNRHLYRVGAENAYDLYVLDNAPAGVTHPVVCHRCKDMGIKGLRWKCNSCENCDLCNKCYGTDQHEPSHQFSRYDTRASNGDETCACSKYQVSLLPRVKLYDIQRIPGGEGQQGTVKEDGKPPYRSLVIVQWASGKAAVYRVGADGYVDLKCVAPASGGYYYKSHLPALGKTVLCESKEAESFLELMQDMGSSMFNPLRGEDFASTVFNPRRRLELMSKLSKKKRPSGFSEIREGTRVVRGPDWKWKNQDGGEGHMGTVKKVTGLPQKSSVKVIWESGDKNIYRAGFKDCYDLLVYESAPSGIKHLNVTCNECKQEPIYGARWKCADCDNIDLCTVCYNMDKHDLTHAFLRMDKQSSRAVPVPKRCDSVKVTSKGIFEGAQVKRGKHWKWDDVDGGQDKEGLVVKITKWTPETRRSGAMVTWPGPSNKPVRHRLGHKGKMDLKFSKPVVGGHYYKTHLAILGKREKVPQKFKVGDKVNIIIDVEAVKRMQEDHGGWNDGMIKYMKKVGMIIQVDDFGVVIVKYDDKKLVYNQDVLNLVWLNPEVKQGPTSSQEQTTPSSSQRDSAPSSLVDKMDVHYSSNELRTVQPQCKICLSCDSCVAFVPCGHLVSCPKCAEGVDKCPICRADIIQLLRTYIQ